MYRIVIGVLSNCSILIDFRTELFYKNIDFRTSVLSKCYDTRLSKYSTCSIVPVFRIKNSPEYKKCDG